MTAVQVNSLLIDAMRTSDRTGSIGVPRARSAVPYPLAKTVRPPATTETTAPGTWLRASWSGRVRSKKPDTAAALGWVQPAGADQAGRAAGSTTGTARQPTSAPRSTLPARRTVKVGMVVSVPARSGRPHRRTGGRRVTPKLEARGRGDR